MSTSPFSSRLARLSRVFALLALFSLFSLFLMISSPRIAAAQTVSFDRVEGTTLHFKSEGGAESVKPLKTGIHDIQFLRMLQSSEGGLPHVLFTGRPCDGCGAEPAVYLMRVDGAVKPLYFVYPGRIVDPKKKQVILDSQAFYGKCLPGIDEGYFAFQKERLDRRAALQKNVFIAELGKVMVKERLIEKRAPSINAVRPFVKAKTCFELDGRNRQMLKKPLDLNPRRGQETDDEEAEVEETKENQTAKDLPSQTE